MSTQEATLADSTTFQPVKEKERISSIDTLRGFALFGIILLNIIGFGMHDASFYNPNIAGGNTGINHWIWIIQSLFLEGTMRATFSMLFGVGMILIITKLERQGSGIHIADIYYRRCLWLIFFGVIHGYLLLWQYDILYGYGICGLFIFPLRNLRSRTLLICGLIMLLSLVPKEIYSTHTIENIKSKAIEAETLKSEGQELSEEQLNSIKAWKEKREEYHPTEKAIQEDTNDRQKGYFANVASLASKNASFQSSALYEFGFFDAIGMFLIGMALFKWGVFSAKLNSITYLWMVLLGYGIGVTTNIFETLYYVQHEYDFIALHKTWLTYDLGRFSVTAGHIGLIMLMCKNNWLRWLINRLAAVGRMALTNYIMQTVICIFVFDGFGLGFYGELQRYQLYYVVFAICLIQMIYSPIWLRYFQMGPLEWLWRSLVYLKKPPMRIK
jgi:uncharacterized protein